MSGGGYSGGPNPQLTVNGTLTNTVGANVTVGAGGGVAAGGLITTTGAFTNAGTVEVDGGSSANSYGEILITGAGGYSQTAGTTQGTGTISAGTGGMTISGGTIIAGTAGNPGTLTINGNYTQTGGGLQRADQQFCQRRAQH
jgi:hypothetical protein